jgi:uncharacterized membrane protein
MSALVVLDFDGVGTADEVLTKLRSMEKALLIDLEDACIVVHTEAGKLQIKQAINLAAIGAASGASSGMLVGAVLKTSLSSEQENALKSALAATKATASPHRDHIPGERTHPATL